ncbi:MAG: Gfo/Idh/MocA family oxidoreductase, partial [Lentisphaerae bacterium]|nr:Gfo/Idh/MocA family oxidoreductase [Lentisphaerota bacterium]
MAVQLTMNRRRFLSAVGIGAAPLVVPGVVLGDEGGRPPNDRITVGFIGVGNMGMGNLRGFLWSRDCQIVAVCDVDQSRCDKARDTVNKHYAKERASGTYRGCAACSDFREIIARDDIDAVVISTADHWHVLAALAAVRSGKDVYVEKPLSVTIEEGRVLSDAARRYGRVLQMGSQQRSDQRFRFACELVRNGRIGEVKHVKVGLSKGRAMGVAPAMPVPKGFDYDMWLGPAPWAPYTQARCHYNFRFISDYSGGQMLNWGSHHLDIAQWGLGTDRSGPAEVKGRGEYPKDGLFD